jgi:hypothetical protein
MKIKIKIDDTTTLDDIRKELDSIKNANINEIPLNQLRKIITFLGATEIPGKGSSVRFQHKLLERHPLYHGYFQIHKIHKGGDQDFIKRFDFKSFLYNALITIIEIKEKQQTNVK